MKSPSSNMTNEQRRFRLGQHSHALYKTLIHAAVGLSIGVGIAVAAQRPQKPSESEIVATVNGEPILRTQIASDLIANQTASLSAGRPEYKDSQPVVAASIGGLVLKRLASGGSK